ncbi:MAG TPA: NADH-quinone oxidoreductase subunit L [Candidatus Binatia bacterium]|jgi:NADH-quinone oxidoreductase subunit L|nr:NADH-quinone oxidoreductase subunit L [Candidatus Binatia bacterium]
MEHPIQTDYLRWIVFLPLLGAVVNGLLGAQLQKRLGKRAISLIACAPVLGAFLISVVAFWHLLALEPEQRFLIDRLYPWLSLGSLKVDVAFWIDPLSAVMILVVTGIGGLIHIYSIGYMHEDKSYWRFFAFLNLFTFAMLLLVLGDNLLLMFVGWEGVGLCSYALIGFWYQDHVNTTAGNKAFIVNRVGDFGFVLGIFLIFWTLDQQGHGTVTFREIEKFALLLNGQEIWGIGVATLATLFLFIGATGKSAQIPLHVWLPDAMQGPTPVSALIHAATMVTAGVYMIARLHFLYSMAPFTLSVVAVIGVTTALFAATIALTQNDIKRVLAYSTISQLGYMFLGAGVAAYGAAIFHLMTHAFFKACLFLGSGSVIHAMGGEQDMRKMGGLRHAMPYTFWTFTVSVLAIGGTPLTAGFFSKDEILWKAFSSEHGSQALWALGVVGAGLTAFYMFRQLFLVFFGECRADHHVQEHLHESPKVMTMPLVILAIGSIAAGWIGLPEIFGGSQFAKWLEPVFGEHHEAHASATSEELLMICSVGVAAFGFFIAYFMYYRASISPERFSSLAGGAFYRLFYNKYYVDEIYHAIFVRGALLLARIGAWIDQYIIDFIVDGSAKTTAFVSWLNGLFDNYVVDWMVNTVANLTFWAGGKFRRVQTGNINSYLYVILGAVVLAIIVRLRYSG